MSARTGALVAGGLLLAALVVLAALTTPWQPLPGGAGTPHWATDFTAAERAREQAFHHALRPPAYLGLVAGLAAAAVLGLTRLGPACADRLARPLGGGWAWRVCAGVLVVLLGQALAALPFDALAEGALRRYGLSTRSWAGWGADTAKSAAVGLLVTAGAVLPLAALARRLPRWWWAPAAVLVAAFVVVASSAYPVVVEPLFNRFSALPAGPLRDDLLALARRDGVPVREVLVADASRRTTAENAYVSGIGSTRRIVVYDTLLARSSPAEVRLVVAHELGHARRGDVPRGTALGALGAAAAVCLAGAALGARAGDPRSVPAVLAVLAVGGALLAPGGNLVSRRVEARADVHALDLTGDAATFAASQRRLTVANLNDLDPPPLVYALFATHPTGPQRLALARAWARDHGSSVPSPLAAGGAAP